jgi:hypothetical protein
MNSACTPFFPAWQVSETDSDPDMVACQAQQVRQESSADVVRQIPHCGDDEAFAARLQRAWQKMLDEDYFGAMGQQDRERTA